MLNETPAQTKTKEVAPTSRKINPRDPLFEFMRTSDKIINLEGIPHLLIGLSTLKPTKCVVRLIGSQKPAFKVSKLKVMKAIRLMAILKAAEQAQAEAEQAKRIHAASRTLRHSMPPRRSTTNPTKKLYCAGRMTAN